MFELTKLITAVIMPPFNALLLWLFALCCFWLNRKKLATAAAILGITLLYLFSLPYTSTLLYQSLLTKNTLNLEDYRSAQAIVLLGGGLRESEELFSDLATHQIALERVRYAAFLQRETALPLLITGSSTKARSEAKVMAEELNYFYRVPTTWLEEQAKTTTENAHFSRQILNEEQIDKIILVTNQWHMQRAKMLFEQQGFEVLPAPVGTGSSIETYGMSLMNFIPQASAMSSNMIALKEWLGYWKEK